MNNIDLIILLLLLCFYELHKMKNHFLVFSPIVMVSVSLIYIYVIPIMVYDSDSVFNYVQYLDKANYLMLVNYVRTFIYCFTICSFFYIKKKSKAIKRLNESYFTKHASVFDAKEKIKVINLLSVAIIILIFALEFVMCGFSPALFIAKLLHPRDNIVRNGVGIFNEIIGFLKLLLAFLAATAFFSKKSLQSFLLCCAALIMNILGGSKSSVLLVVIITFLIYKRIVFDKKGFSKKSPIIKYLSVGLLFIVAVLVSFALMRSTADGGKLTSLNDILSFIVDYDQEAYFTGRVIVDFEPKFEHFSFLVESFVCTPIPRFLWHNKGYYSFFNGYWRQMYQPDTTMDHTSTYGLLAEGHMLFGIMTPFLYVIITLFIVDFVYNLYYSNSASKSFLGIFMISSIYFSIRAGLFEPSTLWNFIIYFALFSLITKTFGLYQKYSKKHPCQRSINIGKTNALKY